MFNLQGSELIIILLLALVVLGPEKLPDAMRKVGQFYAELKKMSSGFQSEFRAVVDEPLRELKDTANTIRDSADFTSLQTGERTEKPKSAEMLEAADADATPTSDIPFGQAAGAATVGAVGADRGGEAVADGDEEGPDDEHVEVATPPIPAPPKPFSSSQTLSVTPPARPEGDHAEAAETADSGANAEAARPEPFSSSQKLSTSPAAHAHQLTPSDAEGSPAPATPGEPVDEAVEPADGARSDEPSEEHTE